MKNLGSFLKNITVFINSRINLKLFLILSILAHWSILYYIKFDQGVVKLLSYYIIPSAFFSFLVAYGCYMIEMTNRTYEKRNSKVRLFGKMLQIPNLILSGVSISIILAQIFYNAISDGTFFYFLPDLIIVNFCTAANFLFNYSNERDLKKFIIPRKKKETLNFH